MFLLTNITACSFQSAQYDFVKRLITNEDIQEPIKTWSIFWDDSQTDLYAINMTDQIIFADRNINIFYKDHQIYKITGLFFDNAIVEIDSKGSDLLYRLNGKLINIDNCEREKMTVNDSGFKIYSRVCEEQVSGDIYENQIIINPMGLLTDMKFKVRHNFSLVELRKK